MKKILFLLLSVPLLMSWQIGPTLASENGSQPILPVTVYSHPIWGPGLFYPEITARHNDAMVETLIKKVQLYEQRFDDLYLLLEATEAKAQTAENSLKEVPYLLDKAVRQAYNEGMNDGRIGIGVSAGWDFLDQEVYLGVGLTYRIWTWNKRR